MAQPSSGSQIGDGPESHAVLVTISLVDGTELSSRVRLTPAGRPR